MLKIVIYMYSNYSNQSPGCIQKFSIQSQVILKLFYLESSIEMHSIQSQ